MHPYGGVSESVTNWVTWFDNQVKLDIKHTRADSNLIISRPNLEDIVIPLAGPMECKTIKQIQSYRCRNFIFDRY